MKKILVSSFAVFLLTVSVFGQSKDNLRPAALGVSFTLNDYTTAQRIRTSSLSSVLANKKWAKFTEMSPGIALTYFKGLTNYVDFAGTMAGSFANRPFSTRGAFTSEKFVMEADASVQVKLVTEDYWVQPYVSMGAGAQQVDGYFGTFIPVGAGFKVNLYDEAHLFMNSQYRFPVTKETSGYRFLYSFGVAGVIGEKKKVEQVTKVVEIPAVVKEPEAPKDTDGDGVTDDKDKCPDVKGLAKYDGCPIPDTDKDGINDEEDKCPTVAGVARYQGCPVPDTDKDGINDEEDKCPTVPGIAANNGCPEVSAEVVKEVNYAATRVLFATGSARLLASSNSSLNEVAKVLNADKGLKLTIDGYTDNVGNEAFNMTLSQQRADAVKNYFIAKGIDADRLISKGHGESNPIADNNTADGRQKNRRVTMKLGY